MRKQPTPPVPNTVTLGRPVCRGSIRQGSHRHRKRNRRIQCVLLNGEDVTRRCQAFDTKAGWVLLFTTMPPTLTPDRRTVALRRHYGQVRAWLRPTVRRP